MIEFNHGRTVGLVLAGGRATRMGGIDKGLVRLGAKPLARWVYENLEPQVADVIINANRNRDAYAALTPKVIDDNDTAPGGAAAAEPSYHGPLAGMLAGMRVATTIKNVEWMITVPCDSPFLPVNFVERMGRTAIDSGRLIVTATDGARIQPVFNLLSLSLARSLDGFLQRGGRKIDTWFAEEGFAEADFSDLPDTFVNINTEQQRLEIEARLTADNFPMR